MEHDDVDINGLNCLHGLLSSVLGLPHFHVSCTRRQFGEQNCGAAAITFLQHRLTGPICLKQPPSCRMQQMNSERPFGSHWRASPKCPDHGAGVQEYRCTSRAQCAVATTWSAQSSSPDQSQTGDAKHRPRCSEECLEGRCTLEDPEIVANQQKPSLQLVMPDELNAVMQERKTKKATPKASGPKVMPSKPMDIDPAKLTLADASFQMEAGAPAPQVAASQVGPLAVGVALMSFAEAKPFLQSGQTLTNKCLAILVINGPDELHTTLQWSSIRFAACCAVNNQPVLLSGHLVQLGVQPIVPVFTRWSHCPRCPCCMRPHHSVCRPVAPRLVKFGRSSV